MNPFALIIDDEKKSSDDTARMNVIGRCKMWIMNANPKPKLTRRQTLQVALFLFFIVGVIILLIVKAKFLMECGELKATKPSPGSLDVKVYKFSTADKMKNSGTIFLVLFVLCQVGFPQGKQETSSFSVDGYIETYYVYDFNNPESNTRPGFIYSFNRHNEVNLNLGFIRGSYNTNNVRTNLALMSGTYANANLTGEPGVLKNVFEANAGVKISAIKNLWIDAGIFGSHIGFESAVGKDCWNLTRSIQADNTPYYEAGVRISYTTDNEKWFLSGLVLNGWQRIQRVEGNSLPSSEHRSRLNPTMT